MQALLETILDSAWNVSATPVGTQAAEGDWPRPMGYLDGLAMSAEAEPPMLNPARSEKAPAEGSPIEVIVCPKHDWATVWMDRMASGFRLIRESIQLAVLIWPWLLGMGPVGANASGAAGPDVAADRA
jgi:hypothetical protein